MNATIRKWGNSLALRIPGVLARDVALRQGTVVEISVRKTGILIRPRKRRGFSLSGLLKGVTAGNRHSEHVWGGPAGSETW